MSQLEEPYGVRRVPVARNAIDVEEVYLPQLEGPIASSDTASRRSRNRRGNPKNREEAQLANSPGEKAGGSDLIRLGRVPATFHEWTQMLLAAMLVAGVPACIVLAWAAFIWAGKPSTEVTDFTMAVLGTITGLCGAVLGYYYGSKEAERRPSAPARTQRPKL